MTTEPAALAIRCDHLDRILDQYAVWNDGVDPGFLTEVLADRNHRYLLVETSNFTGAHEFSTHSSPASAFHYSANQECAEDWEPIRLIDLDTLLSMSLIRTFGVEVDGVHKILLLENT